MRTTTNPLQEETRTAKAAVRATHFENHRESPSGRDAYWTTGRGAEAIENSYRLLDLTVYGRQETWEDSPSGWPQRFEGKQAFRTDGRPTAQWSRLKAGYSDDLGTTPR